MTWIGWDLISISVMLSVLWRNLDSSFHFVPFTMTYTLIFSDTDRSSTLSGRPQPDSVEDLSVLNLPE